VHIVNTYNPAKSKKHKSESFQVQSFIGEINSSNKHAEQMTKYRQPKTKPHLLAVYLSLRHFGDDFVFSKDTYVKVFGTDNKLKM